jgi:hypothetical protein
VKYLLALFLLLFAATEARAEPSWWQQLYAQVGYRASLGLERAGAPTLAIGYRHERGRWALDLAAFDVQQGLDEGVHELGRLGLVYRQPLLRGIGWLSVGAGYSIARGWAATELPRRRGNGVQLGVSAGYDLPVSSTLRGFGRIAMGVPLYDLRDPYESVDSSMRILPIDFAIGMRF